MQLRVFGRDYPQYNLRRGGIEDRLSRFAFTDNFQDHPRWEWELFALLLHSTVFSWGKVSWNAPPTERPQLPGRIDGAVHSPRMSPNFAECGVVFESNLTLYANYVYNGPVEGTWKDNFGSALMTLEGCYELCGKGPDYYSWPDSSATILTWVLPVIGLIVLAPYESNAKRKTLFLMCRYIGSPLASLSYILWNIKVTGKCGLIVDMATGFEDVPDRDTAFGRIRDSL